MTRLAYLYTYVFIPSTRSSPERSEWRVYPALVMKEPSHKGDKAQLLFVDEYGGIRIENEFHITCRNSAASWVYAEEFILLAQDIKQDWERRHCWEDAYKDVCRIEETMKKWEVSDE